MSAIENPILISPNSQTPRLLVERFAAHLAHLLNAGGEAVSVDLSCIYMTLIKTLGSQPYQRLTGTSLAPEERTVEEISEAYFDRVLDRRLFLKGNEPTHKAHELFLALCRRGLSDGWAIAELKRSPLPLDPPFGAPPDFASVAQRLSGFDARISPGNPAANTRARLGPLVLTVRQARTEVPEELPIWQAIKSSPLKLKKLAKGDEFDGFCSLVIKAVETANRPIAAILTLGLSPYDWGDVLTVNTARALSRFLQNVKKKQTREGNTKAGAHHLELWREVWDDCRVPGFSSADVLWNSEIGRALRTPLIPQRVTLDAELAGRHLPEGEMLESASFEQLLRAARAATVLNDFDVWIFTRLKAGATLAELEAAPQVKAASETIGDLATYLEALSDRVYDWARNHLEGTDSLHPDNEPLEVEED